MFLERKSTLLDDNDNYDNYDNDMNNTNDVVRFARDLLNTNDQEENHTADSCHVGASSRTRHVGRTQSSSPAKSRLDGFEEEYGLGDISGVANGEWIVYLLFTFTNCFLLLDISDLYYE